MQIGLSTQRMNGGQVDSRDENILMMKYDADLFFLPDFLFIGDHILFGGFKIGDEVLYLSGLGVIFFCHIMDSEFILGGGHEC